MLNVICAIIFFDEKILVVQRSDKMKLPLKWEFPGGKLEDGESESDCIQREIMEEINIEIDVIRKISNSIYDYGDFKINLIPFIARYASGEIQLAEHNDYKLLSKSDLLNLDWAEADLPIVAELLKMEQL
ncbi:NUDIX hydrolase [Flavobacterium saliperosum S13]|uniref:8-oxo-dGTP diphosphatase n=2 Tax=Flavobacterium saliperosum TaxID=329186 RepID=A0A1G4V2Y1_9FLAO|nr:(deoxy)nucleoside triphosphate pyrophosphohydrolase [Flavobacterium saliperosum]ESU27671.1 NUDIX hydrolase [Flavobacterium saliperosum S13]SCX00381.1 8-oxo-dGTP diphosphatase [Flavobacterium saliperosum]